MNGETNETFVRHPSSDNKELNTLHVPGAYF